MIRSILRVIAVGGAAIAALVVFGGRGASAAVMAPNAEVGAADAVLLAVKPQQMKAAATALAAVAGDPLFISIAAGIRIDDLSRWLGGRTRIDATTEVCP